MKASRAFITAATCSAMILNNPGGHALLDHFTMRLKYHSEYQNAQKDFGDMSFLMFRDNADVFLTSSTSDFNVIKRAVNELKSGQNVFCLPLGSEEQPNMPTDGNMACHAICSRREQKFNIV